MMQRQVWLVTGATRGMGRSFVEAARSVGHSVVATGRRVDGLAAETADDDTVLAVPLDVTDPSSAQRAVDVAIDRFGRVDVLVNSAGASYKGYFEEMSPAQVAAQLDINLVGPMHVTRAVLPVMRRQRSGLVVNVSSGAGLMGFEYSSVYAASKAGLEAWTNALAAEVEPYGIRTMVVNPGFFRTGLAGPESLVMPDLVIDDYAERSAAQRAWWQAQDGVQPGDPDKLARTLVHLAGLEEPPRRFIAGSDVIGIAERKIAELQAQVIAQRDLAASLTFDDERDD